MRYMRRLADRDLALDRAGVEFPAAADIAATSDPDVASDRTFFDGFALTGGFARVLALLEGAQPFRTPAPSAAGARAQRSRLALGRDPDPGRFGQDVRRVGRDCASGKHVTQCAAALAEWHDLCTG